MLIADEVGSASAAAEGRERLVPNVPSGDISEVAGMPFLPLVVPVVAFFNPS
jgi:hypothetical protein